MTDMTRSNLEAIMIGGIEEIISKGELPPDSAPLLQHLTEPSGQFIAQEGSTWDFKREWPFSYSDTQSNFLFHSTGNATSLSCGNRPALFCFSQRKSSAHLTLLRGL